LQKLLDKFIKLFILCPNCHLPETALKVRKDLIKVDCAACGHNGNLEGKHKLATYIVKNPPVKKKAKGDVSSKDLKKDAKKKGDKDKDKKKKKGKSSPNEGSQEDEEVARGEEGETAKVVWYTDTSKEAVEERKKEELQLMGVGDVEELETKLHRIANRGDSNSDSNEEPQVYLKEFVKEEGRTSLEIVSEIQRLGLVHHFTSQEKFELLLESIVEAGDSGKTFVKTIAQYAGLFSELASTTALQQDLILSLEKYLTVTRHDLLGYAGLIFEELYEKDALPEGPIIEWFDSVKGGSNDEFRKTVKVFVDWLKTAEEDE